MNYKRMVEGLLPGWSGRLAAHHVCYLGDGHVHRGVPYVATNPKVIAQKLTLMQDCGIDLIIGTWQGPWAASCHLDATLTCAMCAEFGMQFALLLDPWCAKLSPTGATTAPSTANVIAALEYPSTVAMLESSSYIPEKYILDFNTGADLPALGKQFSAYKFLPMNAGFSWISISAITDSVKRNAAAVANLKTQHANPAMKIASFCTSFDDSGMPLPAGVQTQVAFEAAGGQRDNTQSVWGGPARILDGFEGEFMEQQIATIPATVPIVAILTWDDVDERSSGPLEETAAAEAGVVWAQ